VELRRALVAQRVLEVFLAVAVLGLAGAARRDQLPARTPPLIRSSDANLRATLKGSLKLIDTVAMRPVRSVSAARADSSVSGSNGRCARCATARAGCCCAPPPSRQGRPHRTLRPRPSVPTARSGGSCCLRRPARRGGARRPVCMRKAPSLIGGSMRPWRNCASEGIGAVRSPRSVRRPASDATKPIPLESAASGSSSIFPPMRSKAVDSLLGSS
jgi:hypothetical protein